MSGAIYPFLALLLLCARVALARRLAHEIAFQHHLAGGLSHVGSAVQARLTAADLAPQLGKTWDFANINLTGEWLRPTPAGMLGKTTSSLVVAEECSEGADCNVDFGLHTCSSDADCTSTHSSGARPSCVPVLSTVTTLGAAPTKLCVGHSDSLYELVYSNIVQTERYLDISSLSPPDERFLAAVRNAFTVLHHKNLTIEVRMVFGIASVTNKSDIGGFLQNFLDDVLRDVHGPSRLRISVGTWIDTTLDVIDVSWNHAKIIAVDGRLLIQGGHNLWTRDYLVSSPVLDISMAAEGEVAVHGHRFLDQEWAYICAGGRGAIHGRWTANFPPADPLHCPPIPLVPETPQGQFVSSGATVKAFSIGRLGNIGEVTADRAIEAMLDSAESSIKLALQDLGPALDVKVPYNWYITGHRWAMIALAKALHRGVKVSIVQSGLKAMDAYGVGWSPLDVAKMVSYYLKNGKEYGISHQLDVANIKNLVCANFLVSTVHYEAEETEWAKEARCPASWLNPEPDCDKQGSRSFGGHAKFWVIDDTAFYVGSQNLYPNNLAEWGLMIDDAAATAHALSAFWDPLWAASAPYATVGLESSHGDCLKNLQIPYFPLA